MQTGYLPNQTPYTEEERRILNTLLDDAIRAEQVFNVDELEEDIQSLATDAVHPDDLPF